MWNRAVFVIGYRLPFIHQSLSQVHGQGQNLTRTPAKVKMQKSKKPRVNKKTKKTISQDSCKCKNAKIKKTSRKTKKTRHFYFCRSPGIFLCFFCFLEVFWNFHFYCYCMLCFFVFFLFCLFLFFLFFLFNRAKSFLVELWADKRVQKVDLGGGIYIYIFWIIYIYIYS